jgi:protein-L-isoaspartate(D-aspartate) O-methyltransferase
VASRSTFNVGMLQNTWRQRESSDGRTASPRTSFPNAGATRPAATCLDGLSQDGRLILPLTTNRGFIRNDPPVSIERRGAVSRIERRSSEFLPRWISPVPIFRCEGARDPLSEAALADAFEKGGWKEVTGTCRSNNVREDRCWLRVPGWGLTREFRPSSTTLEALAPGPPRE